MPSMAQFPRYLFADFHLTYTLFPWSSPGTQAPGHLHTVDNTVASKIHSANQPVIDYYTIPTINAMAIPSERAGLLQKGHCLHL